MSEPRRAQRGEGAGSSHQQKKKLLLESLLLALRNSEVARVVDIGTLEYFLDSSYHEMARADTIDLQSFWNVLAKEPGIEPRMIFPPLLAYKSWEERLGVTIFLPRECKELSDDDKKLHGARCPIKAADLDELLTQRKLVPLKAPPSAKPARTERKSTARSGVPAAAAIGFVLGIVGVALGGWLALRPHAPAAVDVSALSESIPLRDGKKSGESMSAVIDDPSFATLPADERRRRAAETFAAAKRMGIRTLLLLGSDGQVKVTMHNSGSSDAIAVAP